MADKNLLYKKKILKQLYFFNVLSCADISTQIDMSIPLTTKMLNEMIEEGFVLETGYAPSTGGRRPLMYTLRPDMMYVVAVAMDQFVTSISIVDMQNKPVTELEKFELPLFANNQAVETLADKIDAAIEKSGIDKSMIAGVGIAMPGFIDRKKGINYSFLDRGGESITGYISGRLGGIRVFIDNDSSLIALTELRFGAARNRKHAMVVNLGWGVGLGMILDGELFKGDIGFAGEFSHIPLFLNNKLCSCGKHGCLETEASLKVLVQKAVEGLKAGELSMLEGLSKDQLEQSSDAIMRAAGKGDKFAVELLSEAGYHIGRGLAILIHLLNPEVIILSGRGSSAGKIWQAPIQQALNEHCIPRLAANTQIEISEFGYQAEIIGAAALVMDNIEMLDIIKNTEKVNIRIAQNN